MRRYAERRRTRAFSPEEWARFFGAFDETKAWEAERMRVRRFGPLLVDPAKGTQRRHGAGMKPDGDASHSYRKRLASAMDVFAMLLVTGSRRGEILGLTWADVDFRRSLVRIAPPKTSRRGIPRRPFRSPPESAS